MLEMTKVKVLCLTVAFVCLAQLSTAAPVTDSRTGNDVVDEIIMKLKQLKQQSEGKGGSKLCCESFWWWRNKSFGGGSKRWGILLKTISTLGPSNSQSNFYGNPRPEEILRVHRTLDNLGGGYLLKRNMDSLGGGYLLKRTPSDSPRGTMMDSLGGGYLL